MASGDVTALAAFKEQLGQKIHDMDTDTFKMGLITSATTPAETTALPHWGGTGTTDWSANECTETGGNYTLDGETLTSVTWNLATATVTWDAADVSILQHASNPTAARWGVIYNSTDANKRVVAFLDLGLDRNLTGGDFTTTWSASGVFTLA